MTQEDSLTIRRAAVSACLTLLLICGCAPLRAQFPDPPGTGRGLPETVEAIDSARVTTRILYITAHPDDESSSVLTYLARGLHADVALLSLTRGEGGQNALGPEQAPQLGLIRTQELLAATRGYGVKLYFTRAKDFGFSKTPEETEKIWGEQVLEDMVRVIRTFRPNVVINHWGGVHTGHGHHQASGLLTPQAVAMAADEKAFPQQMIYEGLRPWGSRAENPVRILELDRFSDQPSGYVLPLDEVSPLYGKSWRQIGVDAFANHRTQGITIFLGSPFLRRPIGLKDVSGAPLDAAVLARPLHAIAGDADGAGCKPNAFFCPVLKAAEDEIAAARASALAAQWENASRSLAQAAQRIASLYPGGSHAPHWVTGDPTLDELKLAEQRMQRALGLAAGLTVEAVSDQGTLVAGETFNISGQRRCRNEVNCEFLGLRVQAPDGWSTATLAAPSASGDLKLQATPDKRPPASSIWNQQTPEPAPLVTVAQDVKIAGYAFSFVVPVTHVEANSTRVERIALRLVPAYTLSLEPKQLMRQLAADGSPFDVLLRVHSYSTKESEVTVGLHLPAGWSTQERQLAFSGAGDAYAKLTVTPPSHVAPGTYRLAAYARRGAETFSTSLEPLPSFSTILWQEPAQCVVHTFEVTVPAGLRVGYITAESEPVPDALRMLGINVELLGPSALNFGDLSRFDAIVVGVRAYELRSDLPGANQRLLDYVAAGGTLLVQYQRDFAWDNKTYAPYRAKINSSEPGDPLPRITDETAAVTFLKPEDQLLNFPNKISGKDFEGWIQERGLYFWSEFDGSKYTPLLSMHDPGEKELRGGLVYTRLGKGTYIYTGLAFFRQLPEGVPGAYRLFVNLISVSRAQ